MLAPLCMPKWRWSESSKYPAQIMFCTKLRGCLCLNPRPFSEVEIDRTCMFEIRLRTAPEIQKCPVVSTQSKQRAAQCEESWELPAAAAEKFTAGRWRGRRRIGQHLLCTTAPSTQPRLAPHYLQNCMLVSTALIPYSHCHHWLFGPNTPFSISNWIALLQIKQSTV